MYQGDGELSQGMLTFLPQDDAWQYVMEYARQERLRRAEEALKDFIPVLERVLEFPTKSSDNHGRKAVNNRKSKMQGRLRSNYPYDGYTARAALSTPYGQWQYPCDATAMPSNNITMQGVDYPVLVVSNTGDTQMMFPGMQYTYNGDYVTEYPFNQYGYGGHVYQGDNQDGQKMSIYQQDLNQYPNNYFYDKYKQFRESQNSGWERRVINGETRVVAPKDYNPHPDGVVEHFNPDIVAENNTMGLKLWATLAGTRQIPAIWNGVKTAFPQLMNAATRPISTVVSNFTRNVPYWATTADKALWSGLGTYGAGDVAYRFGKGELPWYEAVPEFALNAMMMGEGRTAFNTMGKGVENAAKKTVRLGERIMQGKVETPRLGIWGNDAAMYGWFPGLFGKMRSDKGRLFTEGYTDFNTMARRMESPVEYDGENPFADVRMTWFRKWALDRKADPQKILEVEKEFRGNGDWKALGENYILDDTHSYMWTDAYGKIHINPKEVRTADFNQVFPHEVEHALLHKLGLGQVNDIRGGLALKDIEDAFNIHFPTESNVWGANPQYQLSYFLDNGGEEIIARISQIYNALGITEKRPLTVAELKKAKAMLDSGKIVDNNMKDFFNSIKDYKKVAALSGTALSLLPFVTNRGNN